VGFTEFALTKPGTTGTSPKISYNVTYQPWHWILTTGVYVDDHDAVFRSTLYQSLGVLFLLAGVLSASRVTGHLIKPCTSAPAP
jgi:methyl-accepting chemotaxis protein